LTDEQWATQYWMLAIYVSKHGTAYSICHFAWYWELQNHTNLLDYLTFKSLTKDRGPIIQIDIENSNAAILFKLAIYAINTLTAKMLIATCFAL